MEKPLSHPARLVGVAFRPDGQVAATACVDGFARLWDLRTGRQTGPDFHHDAGVRSVVFRFDSQLLLTASEDGTARLWEPSTGKPVGPAFRHAARVNAVAFSPDGRTALTGSYGQTARLWDVPSPVQVDAERVTHWVQSLTGMKVDVNGAIRSLEYDAWQESRRQLGATARLVPP
ncbi:MAG TPA: hypothetical protein VG013_36205 [Gemmataceae bacterium]|jgi:WD40 repeat protein|nr:hypothetical protein [Gemmataceae bacterium]